MNPPHSLCIAQPDHVSRAAARAARVAIRAAAQRWGSGGPLAVVDAMEQAAVDRLRSIRKEA